MVPTILISEDEIMLQVILWVLVILFVSLYLYFSVVYWVLSMVVSVLEECSGIQALEGFLLFVFINLFTYGFFHFSSKLLVVKQAELTQELFGLLLAICLSLMGMFEFQAYAIFYFECKKNHGESVELHGSIEYNRTVPIAREDLL